VILKFVSTSGDGGGDYHSKDVRKGLMSELCAAGLIKRIVNPGYNTGAEFLGCENYPNVDIQKTHNKTNNIYTQ